MMMKALALLPLVSAYQVMDTHDQHAMGVDSHASYDGMRSTLKGISAMQAKGEIDSDTIQTVEEILANITSQLLGALEQDKQHAQNILDAAELLIDNCDSAKNTWNGGAWTTNNGEVTNKNTARTTCRGQEETACQNATNHCNTYTGQVCGWNRCAKPVESRFSNGDTDELDTYICCLEQFFADEKATYYTNRKNCLDAVNTWNTKTDECDIAQTNFEKEFCDREKNVEDKCREYRECRNREQSNYVTVKNQVQELQQIFQAQRVALACLQCYGGKILANATDLSDCEDSDVDCVRDFSDCPQVVFDDIPDCISCVEPNEVPPNTAGFISEFYTVPYDNTCTPAAQSQSCTEWHGGFAQTESGQTCEVVAATAFEAR